MGHKDVDIFHPESVELRKRIAHIAGIHIAKDSPCGFELTKTMKYHVGADVSGMPNLIYILEMLKDASV
jgi:hypothetical protein